MNNEKLLAELLAAWEESYKKGQLSLWIFLALKEEKKYVDEIKTFVQVQSNETMRCEEQSLYRALRKYQHLGVVDFEIGKGNKGPERKYYFLTGLGLSLVERFIDRNIRVFFNKKIINLLKTEV